MVALLISLKIQLLRGGLRGSLSQRIGLAVGAVTGFGAALAGGAGLIGLRFADPDVAAPVVAAAGTVLVLGWGLVPLLVAGVDETLDPARFALLPLRARQLVPGLVLAGLIGVPGAVTTLVAAATVVTWWRGVLPALLAVPAAVLGVLTCVVTSRLLTTAAARMLASRRFKEVGAAIAVLLMSSIGLWPTLLANGALTWPDLQAGLSGLGWTPMGLAWAVPADAATGHPARALLRLVLAVAVVVAGAAGWSRLLDRALADQAGSASATRAKVRRSPLDRLPDGAEWAVMQRSLRYWRRDPRYLVAFFAITASTIVPLVALRSAGTAGPAAGLGPFVGILLGLVTSNDVGYDGSAFATHLVVGVRGQADRLGRAMAALTVGLPVVTVAAVAGVIVAGRGWLWPAALGAGVGALLSGVGASALASALVPYPVPEAGSNPFRGTSGGGARAALAQAAVLSATSALSAPAIACLVVAVAWWPPAAWIALPLGPAIGVAALWVGIAAGGRVMDGRGPEILASVRRPV